jgi:hypothetical protein
MAAQNFLAKLGIRLGTLGSLASLAIAAPLAEGNIAPEANTDATRLGIYFDRTPSQEKMGFVVMGVEGAAVTPVGLSVRGVAYAWPVADAVGTLTSDGAGNLSWAPALTSIAWGDITGDITNQTDLALALGGLASDIGTVAGDLSSHTGLTTTAHGGIVADTDSRLTDARTPLYHAASHATDAADSVFPASAVGYLYNDGLGSLSWAPAGTGSIGGSIAATQIAYGAGTNTIAGSNNLVYDAANGRVGLGTATPVAGIHVKITPVSTIGVIIQGTVGQTDSLTEWRSTDGVTILSSISSIGYFRAPFGTAGAPGLSFQGDTDNGIFRPAANTVSMSTGGIERMRFYSDGGVDIGGTYAASPGAAALRCAGSVQCVKALVTAPGGGSAALSVQNIPTHNGPLFTVYDTSGGSLVNVSTVGLVSIGPDLTAAANLHLKPRVATRIGVIIQGAEAQSANLQEWRNNDGIILASVSPDGVVFSSTFFRNTPQSVTASATITSGRVRFTGTTVGQILTMPGAVDGTDVFVRNAGTVAVTIRRGGADTIEGVVDFILNPGESVCFTAVGTDWTVF